MRTSTLSSLIVIFPVMSMRPSVSDLSFRCTFLKTRDPKQWQLHAKLDIFLFKRNDGFGSGVRVRRLEELTFDLTIISTSAKGLAADALGGKCHRQQWPKSSRLH